MRQDYCPLPLHRLLLVLIFVRGVKNLIGHFVPPQPSTVAIDTLGPFKPQLESWQIFSCLLALLATLKPAGGTVVGNSLPVGFGVRKNKENTKSKPKQAPSSHETKNAGFSLVAILTKIKEIGGGQGVEYGRHN